MRAAIARVNGVTPAIYFEPSTSESIPGFAVGLIDLFTSVSSRLINLNTASAAVLHLIPSIDENIANAIIRGPGGRAGPDGVDGTADDMPFRSPQELARVPGLPPTMAQQLARFFTVRSLVFEVTVDVELGDEARQFVALLRRSSARDIQLLNLYWE